MYLVYEGLFDKIRISYFKKIIKKYDIKKDSKLLDYGCGPGDLLLISQEFGVKAYGIDSFERSVNIAKGRGLDVILGDYINLPYEKDFFDVIFIQSVLEHVNNPIELLAELLKYLKKDGLLVLSCPTPGSYFWNDPTHIRPYTPKSFKILGEIFNLDNLEINYVFSFLLGIKLKNSLIYRILNMLPFSLGSNIIGVYRK